MEDRDYRQRYIEAVHYSEKVEDLIVQLANVEHQYTTLRTLYDSVVKENKALRKRKDPLRIRLVNFLRGRD